MGSNSSQLQSLAFITNFGVDKVLEPFMNDLIELEEVLVCSFMLLRVVVVAEPFF